MVRPELTIGVPENGGARQKTSAHLQVSLGVHTFLFDGGSYALPFLLEPPALVLAPRQGAVKSTESNRTRILGG